MPTELEELVGFLHHGNTQIRQVAVENLVPYSKQQPSIFKTGRLKPVQDLKVLVKDYAAIAKNALTILINISSDLEVLKFLAEDDAFLETLLLRITNPKEPNGNELAMLLANLAKSPSLERLITLKRATVPGLSTSPLAVTQLIELFNAGTTGKYNKDATYDYLAYLFGDLAKYPAFTTHLTTPAPTPSSSPLDPLLLILPHTTSASPPPRLGTASLLKNLALLHPDPLYLLQPAGSILPSILLPLCSANQEGISDEEMEKLPEECRYLDDSHLQEKDVPILNLHLETLYLLSTRGGRGARKVMDQNGVYPVIRELHLQIEDEEVRKRCEKLVDVLMGDEGEVVAGASGEPVTAVNGSRGAVAVNGGPRGQMYSGGAEEKEADDEDGDEDEDDIVPIF